MGLFLLALVFGTLILGLLLLFVNYAAKHQKDEGPIGTIGYIVAGLLSYPLLPFYGPEGRAPALALALAALFDILVISLPVYLLLLIFLP